MKLKMCVSGLQSGADQQGLEEAWLRGIATGGVAPLGYKTEAGPRPDLGAKYGVKESYSPSYDVRTEKNVKLAEVTLWFGNTTSPGYKCTKKWCDAWSRPFIPNPSAEEVYDLAQVYESFNIAGNRLSKNKGVCKLVTEGFRLIPRPDSCKVCVGPTCSHLDAIKKANEID